MLDFVKFFLLLKKIFLILLYFVLVRFIIYDEECYFFSMVFGLMLVCISLVYFRRLCMLENQNESANRPNLLEQIKGVMRVKHYSIRTEEAYVGWVKKFVLFYNKKHPKYMGAKEIENFLTHLAVVGKAAASTQN